MLSLQAPSSSTDTRTGLFLSPAQTTTATGLSGDGFYRTQTVALEGGIGTVPGIPYSPEMPPKTSPPRRLSSPPPIIKYSPASAPTSAATTTATTGTLSSSSNQPSSGPTDTAPIVYSTSTTSISTRRKWPDSEPTFANTPPPPSLSLTKVKTAFHSLRNFPWSSSSEDERRKNDSGSPVYPHEVPSNRVVPPTPPQGQVRRHKRGRTGAFKSGGSAGGRVSRITLWSGTGGGEEGTGGG
ncbi:hypothetical protein L873DRAFT_683430 [Choiromyces venosus 120613-1]|uniref:Uncharacterized protein n=1 Tax=Choiromyces venosus 120613-1 TaxID=1336337 RepID=A0A3N4J5W8_9PEZI|nr:hypothetical protein L873DRAFT_683430 [Choiromyces venosus 120613-1]